MFYQTYFFAVVAKLKLKLGAFALRMRYVYKVAVFRNCMPILVINNYGFQCWTRFEALLDLWYY